ncbi:MAG: hypothetical protein ACQEWU_17480 [Bacillota bacterium]|uniref:Holin n=1 Tax=Virgibacillus salarius TaxID=447199 RepID=A0A941E036_9BACI|nr:MULTISPECIES: hypothetical protein [Bacillaceae]NAZ09217.1 hypothetical protein [Agaribacter marinus]MBR7796508.1 hypothetical protein [Virgibacillus salarius]MCC2252502.1 hypothetical protein [Virgibacillus sp. AGTR]MDY7043748.1 hypothetical protein [Virgibacillus sp. M23]QRZ19412.1 hypothetical protein JUJ52_06960 [Virgibacillus sp. AGTR]
MDSETMYELAGMLFVVFLIGFAVVLLVSLTKVWQTRIKTSKEEVYQKLAAEAIEVQKASNTHQEKLTADMKEIKEKVASMEKMLKEVE